MDEQNPRGSKFLAAKYTEGDLEELLAVGESAGVKLLDFFPFGVPAFDGASGTWRVTPEQIGALLQGLWQLRITPQVIVNPKGVPVNEGFDIVFKIGSQRSL